MPGKSIANQTKRSLRRAIVDFVVAWGTLTSSVFFAFGLASFFHAVPARPFSNLNLPASERAILTGIYAAIAFAGFVYMLWRQEWRLRTYDMLAITAYWGGVCVIAAVHWPEAGFGSLILSVWGVNAVQLAATMLWVKRVGSRKARSALTK